MNVLLLIVCVGLGLATYHVVVSILDAAIPNKPKRNKVTPLCCQRAALVEDANHTKRRMNAIANHYHRMRGTV